jgi:Poxvirus Late Transcription Factor VLTF3 like
MPSFKHKTNKKILVDKKRIMTLDSVHRGLQSEFNLINTEVLPDLIRKKNEIMKKLNNTENPLDVNEKIELQDSLYDIKQEIYKNKKKVKDYYLNNSKFIFDYFENKKEITNGTNKTTILNSFFKVNDKSFDENELNRVNENNVQKFFTNLDQTFININDYIYVTDICQSCNKGEMIPVEHEGIMVCNVCAKQVTYLIENEKPSYKEPPKEACFYAYKRINHFKEILAQFQAKETTQIPEEVLENIKQQLNKERIPLSKFTNSKAKEVLKKLGYNKYYEHIPFIKDKLGIKPPIMTPELEETLCNLFMEIQGPYAKFCPDDRVNFLNYYYTVYKLCELLEKNEFLSYFPMLKDKEKRIEQDDIWKKICEELNWVFIPTQ